MRQECYLCHKKSIDKLTHKFGAIPEKVALITEKAESLFLQCKDQSNPEIAQVIHQMLQQQLDTLDLFEEEKSKSNELLLGQYFYRKIQVENSPDPFYTAARFALAANIVDYGAHSVSNNISDQIETLIRQELELNELPLLMQKIQSSESVLYIGDNAGEIVFDRLWIETMNHQNVTFVVRDQPIINDVTMDDAQHVGMDKVCKVISSGCTAPSTLLQFSSEEFLEAFNKADVVISKGMGNFEGLQDFRKKDVFFALIAKCEPIANIWKVKQGDLVVSRFKHS